MAKKQSHKRVVVSAFLPELSASSPIDPVGLGTFYCSTFVKYLEKNFSSKQKRCWRGTRGQGDAAEQGQGCKREAAENLLCQLCQQGGCTAFSALFHLPSALAVHPKLMPPLNFEPLPGMFSSAQEKWGKMHCSIYEILGKKKLLSGCCTWYQVFINAAALLFVRPVMFVLIAEVIFEH